MPTNLPLWLSGQDTPKTTGGTSAGHRRAACTRRPVLERLEDRCLLSAAAPHHAALALGNNYEGTLQFPRHHNQAAAGGTATLTVTSESTAGIVSGTLVGSDIGTVAVAGKVHGHALSLTFSGDSTGSASLLIQHNGSRLVGTLRDKTAGNRAKLTLARVSIQASASGSSDQPAAVAAAGGSANSGAAGGSDTLDFPPIGAVFPTGRLEFVGTYTGTLGPDSLPASSSSSGGAGSASGQTLPVTLQITGHSDNDLLSGTITISGVGTYDVVGVVKLDQMTFLIAAQGPGYETGDLHLTVSAAPPAIAAGSTNFGPGGRGIGFGTTQVTLTGTFDDSVNGTISHRAIRLSGYAGYDPADVNSGSPTQPTAAIDTAPLHNMLEGTYTGTMVLAQFTELQYRAGNFTGYSQLGSNVNGITSQTVPITLDIAIQTASNFFLGGLTVPGQGTFFLAGQVIGDQTTIVFGGPVPQPPASTSVLGGLNTGGGAGTLTFTSGGLSAVIFGSSAAGQLADEVGVLQGRATFTLSSYSGPPMAAPGGGTGSGTGSGSGSGTGSGTGTGN